MIKITTLLSIFLVSSCSLLGIQNEEQPHYEVIKKDGDFEIRKYDSYVVAKTTVKGDFTDSSSKAFRILAGYIFGKNKGNNKISMTSPVEMNPTPLSIPMTSPVEMNQQEDEYTMSFSMPSNFTIETLPEPVDKRIAFEVVPSRIVASHEYSWFSSRKKNRKKAQELREWLAEYKDYSVNPNYTYAGYNPPWTIPFLRRNEVHIVLRAR